MENQREFKLMELPYSLEALSPYMSKETLEFHYLKHHKSYVDNLNNLIKPKNLKIEISNNKTLYEIIDESKKGPIFNNAAQVFNHNFFWLSLTPDSSKKKINEKGELKQKILKKFGSDENLKKEFFRVALGTFGSGWVWLVKTPEGELNIVSTINADTPIMGKDSPLITCDVWEHAYYIDYRNSRLNYLEAFWKIINWEFADENFNDSHTKEWNIHIKKTPNF